MINLNLKKQKFYLLLLAMLSMLSASAQTNSVELKGGTGTLISQHNSITAAYAAIPASLSQAYIIEITATYTGANETYPIVFTAKTGASTTNTITLRPAAGVTAVSVSNASTGAALFQLNDADYVIVDGRPGGIGTTRALTFNNSGTASSSNTIQLINGACNNIIRYCVVNNSTTGSAGRGIHFSTSASNTTGNSDNLVEFCTVNSGRYAINSNGTAANKNAHNKIYGCDIVNVIFVGIWSQAGTGTLTIDSNRIYCTTASGDTPYGILFDAQTDTAIMSRNKIFDLNHGTSAGLVKGIAIRSVTGTNYSLIYNNFISLSAPNPGCTNLIGIEYAGSVLTNADIYFNTVRVQGTLSSGGTSGNVVSAAFNKTASNTSSVYNIKNNIFVNERTGGNSGVQHPAASLINTDGIITADYNTYNSASGELTRLGTTVFNSLATYQSIVAPNDVNANTAAVQFVSATDLHLAGTSIGNSALTGTPVTLPAPLSGITRDIDNDLRSTTAPYRGADEAGPVACNTPTGLAASGITNVGANLAWIAVTGAAGYEYAVTTSATPPASGTATTGTTHNPTGLTPSTTYYAHVRTSCGTASSSGWATISFVTLAACPAPSPVNVTGITSTTANVSWTAVSGAPGYEYAVTTSATPPASGTATTGTTHNPTGLTPATTYYAHVRTNCATSSSSAWATVSFVTLPSCVAPAPVNVTGITATTANISWPVVSGVYGYEYAVTTSATPPASGTATTATTYGPTGLTPSTVYYAHVRSNCGTSSSSAWTTVSFATIALPVCTTPAPVNFSNITPSSADINWAAVSSAAGYEYAVTTSATPPGNGTATTATSYSAGSLSPGTIYYAHVRTECSPGFYSTWITRQFTTTFPPCVKPVPAISGITTGSVDIGWPAVSGAVGYEFSITGTSVPPASGTATTLTSQTIAGLIDNATYYLHVRTNCGAAGVSGWSTVSFTTSAYCTAPTAIFSNITTNSIDINWNAIAGAISYEYVLDRNVTVPSASGTATTGLNYNAKNLQHATQYYIHMRSICGADVSNWSTSSFMTETVTGINNINSSEELGLYPNPARDYIIITAANTMKEAQVYNAMGALVIKQQINGKEGTLKTVHLAPGMYTIKVMTERGYITRQFSRI